MHFLLLSLLAPSCEERPTSSSAIELTVEQLAGTGLLLSWETPEETDGAVEVYREGELSGWRVPAPTTGSRHQVRLLGLSPLARYDYHLLSRSESAEYEVWGELETRAPPSALPDFQVQEASDEATPGFYLGSVMGSALAAVILDESGELVWWRLEEDEPGEESLLTSCEPSRDGQSVLCALFPANSEDRADGGRLLRLSLDGTSEERFSAPGLHHDFAELPSGDIAYLASEEREWDGEEQVADELVLLHPDGSRETAWSAWDQLTAEQLETALDQGYGWTHANYLLYDEQEDAYLLSLRALDAVLAIDAATGEQRWLLGGGELSDLGFEGEPFHLQHGIQLLGDRLLVFDNSDEERQDTHVLEYELDFEQRAALQAWSYRPEPPLNVQALGNAERLDNGHTLVFYGQAGLVDEVDEDGELLLRLWTGLGSFMGYFHFLGGFDALNPGAEEVERSAS